MAAAYSCRCVNATGGLRRRQPFPESGAAPRKTTRRTDLAPVGLLPLLLAGFVGLLLLADGPRPAAAFLPYDLSNFQSEYACDNSSVRIVRPRTLSDVQAAVRAHSHVKALGGGWSWNQPFFCASNGSMPPMPDGFSRPSSRGPPPPGGPANIVMQTLRPLMIAVNETEESVTVDAGIRTIDLLRYLAAYVTPSAPSGWTLPAFPWFVYQTLGGAVATGTHGSSLKHSSLSSQVLAFTVVLANGTVRTFTNQTDPFLMRALRVNVGKLGVVTHIKFRIVREMPVTRTLNSLPASRFLALLRSAQQQWAANGTLPDWMDETEWFWVPQRHEFLMVSFTRGDDPDASKRLAVLSAYARAPRTASTAYNTSLELLQEVVKGGGTVNVNDWSLLSNVTFDPTTGLSTEALASLRRLNDTVIQPPWHKKEPEATLPRGNKAPPRPPAGPAVARPNASAAFLGGTAAGGGNSGSGGSAARSQIRLFRGQGTEPLSLEVSAAAAAGQTWAIPQRQPETIYYGLPNMADAYIDISRSGVYTVAANATREALDAYLVQPEDIIQTNIRKVLYDQYDFAVPVSTMADCWQGLLELLYGADNLDGTSYNGTASPASLPAKLKAAGKSNRTVGPDGRPDYGFRTNPLVRSIGREDALLSAAGDEPRMWINIEDYLYYNRPGRRINPVFKSLVGFLRSDARCGATGLEGRGARLHWGKAGWPDAGCWHGDKEFPDTWCDFGCAVRELDPSGKFADSAPDRWNWEGAPLERCCVPGRGFKVAAEDPACVCTVRHARDAASCPEAPYYTYR
ncbi:hypothetical protein GPECTOR_218g458 [Gonium pectorale]|uniref:FAD-binding PCMH-type domain-containing protein n=1 Tax=Gonium pectorale TaxID=33097 RepID=A0A150FWN6_GONPE|nr:hypothetical protein GPECTOR_218g458 [Gonium pectorale]|eukprot:KXZ42034.1 hypothetical protein GPECTOR_218g458 [Gonium pectorale]